jgi:hypothetical protein
MTDAVLAGLLAGYGIAIPVGAVGAYLVALSARAPGGSALVRRSVSPLWTVGTRCSQCSAAARWSS